jgi:hypothetical protein
VLQPPSVRAWENVLGLIFEARKQLNRLSFRELLHHYKGNQHRSHHIIKIQSTRIDLCCFRGAPGIRALWRTFRGRFLRISKIESAKNSYFRELLHHRKGNRYRSHHIIKIQSTRIYPHCFRGAPGVRALWRMFRGRFLRVSKIESAKNSYFRELLHHRKGNRYRSN